jgi:thiol-disulfide isomerase/thioredoxin
MRKLQTALALLLMSLPAFLFAQDSRLTIEQKFPKQGEKLNFSYNPAGSELEGAGDVSVNIYAMDKKDARVEEVQLTRSGDKYTGSFQPSPTAALLSFVFTGSGDKKDNNQKQGYIVQLYDDKQQPAAGSNVVMYRLYGGFYGYLTGIERNDEKAFPYIEKEYTGNPDAIRDIYLDYFYGLTLSKKTDAKDLIIAELGRLENLDNLTEGNYWDIYNWYRRLQQKEKEQAAIATMKQKFPNGEWKRNEAIDSIAKEKDLAKKQRLLDAYIKEFNLAPEKSGHAKWMVAQSYAKENKWDQFFAIVKDLDTKTMSGQYNNTAWGWVEKGENLEAAKKISKLATDYAKQEMNNPTTEKPVSRTMKQWKQDREGTYAMYADTYAFILYKLGDYKTGFQYIKEAVTIQKKKEAEYNDRYALLLEKTAPATQVKKEMEELVKNGTAGKEARGALQRSYVKVNKSDKGFEAYMNELDAANLAKLKEELKKKMLSKNAPDFRLVNLQGNEVDFASLKGKVVVVDFWATWCGPCISSFPSMQKMVNKYKNNPDVVFLFIDTWENVPNRKKLVEDFVAKNKYTFNVLYDKPKEEGSSEFTVVKDYEVEGIPTKFVVDGNGQIRFKSIGWSGNEFAFMQELQLMIEMAGGSSGTGEGQKKGF